MKKFLCSILLAVGFAVPAATPADLLSSAAAYQALSDRDLAVINAYQLGLLASAGTPANTLSNAAPWQALSDRDLAIINCYLLGQISLGGTGTNTTNIVSFTTNIASFYQNGLLGTNDFNYFTGDSLEEVQRMAGRAPIAGFTATLNTDDTYLQAAQYLHDTRLAAAGYNLIATDWGWFSTNRVNGWLVPRPDWHPNGLRWLAQAFATNGCQLGLYVTPSPNGQDVYGYYTGTRFDQIEMDALSVITNGASYVKVDWTMFSPPTYPLEDAEAWSARFMVALQFYAASNHQAMPYIFNSGAPQSSLIPTYGNSYLITTSTSGDPQPTDTWIQNVQKYLGYPQWAGPGHTLCAGDLMYKGVWLPTMTNNFAAAQGMFGMLCLYSSQLIANEEGPNTGTNNWMIPTNIVTLWTNREALRIDRDPAAMPAVLWQTNANGVWTYLKSCQNGDIALGLLNTNQTTALAASVDLTQLPGLQTNVAQVLDVFGGTNLMATNIWTVTIGTNTCRLYRVLNFHNVATAQISLSTLNAFDPNQFITNAAGAISIGNANTYNPTVTNLINYGQFWVRNQSDGSDFSITSSGGGVAQMSGGTSVLIYPSLSLMSGSTIAGDGSLLTNLTFQLYTPVSAPVIVATPVQPPTLSAANGSLCIGTNGALWVRTNGAWVAK